MNDAAKAIAVQLVHLQHAQLCVGCNYISDVHGDTCPACGESGGLLSLARLFAPREGQGRIIKFEVKNG